jgi:hypothetical protein
VQVTAVGEAPLGAGFDLERVGSVAGRDVDHSGGKDAAREARGGV